MGCHVSECYSTARGLWTDDWASVLFLHSGPKNSNVSKY